MKCPNCSQEVEPSAVFCGNCGNRLKPDAPAATPPQPELPPADPSPVIPQASLPAAPQPSHAAPVPVAPVAPMAPVAPVQASQPIPQYAVGQPQSVKGSGYLTAALILAILSVPGAILPVAGLLLSLTAIVLAIKHHHAGTGRMVAATVFGGLGLLLSLGAWAYNVKNQLDTTGFTPSYVTSQSAFVVNHSTAAYKDLFVRN